MTVKIPISGGPHTGKSTLLEALKVGFPEAYFVPEPAEIVIRRELALEAENQNYIPRVPWIDYSLFGPLVAAQSVELEAKIPPKAELVFLDRSLIDTIAYSAMNGFESYIPEVKRLVRAARYSVALFCHPVGTYTPTDVRRETSEEALITHQHLQQAYVESGIELIALPNVPVDQRVRIIKGALSKYRP